MNAPDHEAMLRALQLWVAYDLLLRRDGMPDTIFSDEYPAIDAAYDECVVTTRALLNLPSLPVGRPS